jgi:hypothetical protein
MLLKLALVGLLFILSNSSRAQQKNTLRLWVDTLYIDTAQTDVLLNVKFKLDVQRPPVNFRGYKAEIDYGPSSYVRVVGGNSGVITQNTASRFITDPIITVTDNSVTVVALGSEQAPIDTTYSTLFTLRLTAYKPVGGGGMPQGARADFIWDPIASQIVDDSNIDTIIFGSGFVERRTTPILPTFDTVKISLPAMTVSRDSTFDVPVIFDTISKSKVKHFAFSFDFDSSVVRFDDAILASDIQGFLSRDIQPTHGAVLVEAKDSSTFFGADTLFYLRFTSKGRTDTICTSLTQVGFLPVNGDAKVDSRLITIGEMCVQGFTPEPTKVVREYEGLRDLFISPNPASEIVVISVPEQRGRFSVEIFDVAGHSVYAAQGIGRIEWRPAMAAAGAYNVIVTLDGQSVLRHVIIR